MMCEYKKRLKLPVWKSSEYGNRLIGEMKHINLNISMPGPRPGDSDEIGHDLQ